MRKIRKENCEKFEREFQENSREIPVRIIHGKASGKMRETEEFKKNLKQIS